MKSPPCTRDQLIVAFYKRGVDSRKISKLTGVSFRQINRTVLAAGVPLRSRKRGGAHG